MPAAPPPTYQPGDTYTYSRNGQTETREVLSVRGEQVRWRSAGVEWVEQTAVVTPPLAWTADPTVGRGQQEIIGDPYSLFPLQVGKKTTFEARGKSDKVPAGWTRQYSCAVEGNDTVTVPAGTFETFRIECRQGDQLQTIHYAPSADNIVLGVAQSPSRTDRFELRSYTHAAAAAAPRPAAAAPAPAPIPVAQGASGAAGGPRDIMPSAPRPMPAGMAAAATATPVSPQPAMTPPAPRAREMASATAPVPVAIPPAEPRPARRLPPVPPDARPSPHFEGAQVKPVIGRDGKPVIAPDGAPVMLTLDDRGVPITEVASARRAGPMPAQGGTMAMAHESRGMAPTATAMAPAAGSAAHLASYRSEFNAERGWTVLERQFPTALAGLHPTYRTVDLPGKGRYIRLFATGFANDSAARQLCASVSASGAYCRVMALGG